jgi:hypothetical protein
LPPLSLADTLLRLLLRLLLLLLLLLRVGVSLV